MYPAGRGLRAAASVAAGAAATSAALAALAPQRLGLPFRAAVLACPPEQLRSRPDGVGVGAGVARGMPFGEQMRIQRGEGTLARRGGKTFSQPTWGADGASPAFGAITGRRVPLMIAFATTPPAFDV
jgi:hypothetical protein